MDRGDQDVLPAVEKRDKESDRLSSAAISRRSYRSMVQSYAEKNLSKPTEPAIWDPVVKEAERQRRSLHSASDHLLDEYEVCIVVHNNNNVHIIPGC